MKKQTKKKAYTGPRCNRCGAPIRFIRTRHGTWMPAERQPVAFFAALLGVPYLTADGRTIRGLAITEHEPPGGGEPIYVGYQPHRQVCPAALAEAAAEREEAGNG